MDLAPVMLFGRHVRLLPLTAGHADALWTVARDAGLWRWQLSQILSRADMDDYVRAALDAQAEETALPFVIVAGGGAGEVVGSTRFANAEPAHGRVEIGWTWIGQPWQRTPVNTETKRLLLEHAFETLGVRRVDFKTDALNAQSRAALARLGATEEGTLRQHMVTAGGRARDSVYFSVLVDEWPDVRARLDAFLARR